MLHNRQYRCYRDSIPIATWVGSYPTRIDALWAKNIFPPKMAYLSTLWSVFGQIFAVWPFAQATKWVRSPNLAKNTFLKSRCFFFGRATNRVKPRVGVRASKKNSKPQKKAFGSIRYEFWTLKNIFILSFVRLDQKLWSSLQLLFLFFILCRFVSLSVA